MRKVALRRQYEDGILSVNKIVLAAKKSNRSVKSAEFNKVEETLYSCNEFAQYTTGNILSSQALFSFLRYPLAPLLSEPALGKLRNPL